MIESEDIERGLTPLQSEAHGWIRRLVSGEATEADARALRQWCAQSPAHAAAFSEASQFWEAFGPAGRSLLEVERPRATVRRVVVSRRAFIGGALAASAAGLVVANQASGVWPSFSELRADYRTGVGEQRQVHMAGGVSITMNTRTSLSVRVDGEPDAVELIAGEASFVTSDSRPGLFSVIAAGGRASARNAKFDLKCIDDGASVACLDAQVRVEYRGRAVMLAPRQRVTYGPGGLGDAVTIDPAVASAWQNGLLIFVMTPLAEVIEELNRYRPGRIVLLRTELVHAPVNGRFRIDRPDEALLQIERAFGVHGRNLPGGLVLLS